MAPSRPAELPALRRLAALATVLGLVLLALLGAGGRLPPPPVSWPGTGGGGAWSGWLARVGPAGALMSGIRLVGLASTGYLLLVVTVELLGRAAGLPRVLGFGRRVSTPLARRLVGGVAGLGLAAALAAAPAGPVRPASADTITMAAPAPGVQPPAHTATDAERGAPVMRVVEADDGDVATMHVLDQDPAPLPADGAPPTPTTTADRWVIQPGDHLWGVARRTLAGAWHRPPSDAEVARYLDRLIDANRAVLVVPGDADLVLAGQQFALPPVPAA